MNKLESLKLFQDIQLVSDKYKDWQLKDDKKDVEAPAAETSLPEGYTHLGTDLGKSRERPSGSLCKRSSRLPGDSERTAPPFPNSAAQVNRLGTISSQTSRALSTAFAGDSQKVRAACPMRAR